MVCLFVSREKQEEPVNVDIDGGPATDNPPLPAGVQVLHHRDVVIETPDSCYDHSLDSKIRKIMSSYLLRLSSSLRLSSGTLKTSPRGLFIITLQHILR